MHGNGNQFYCPSCFKEYSTEDIIKKETVPICDKCGNIIRPNIVLYGEQLDRNTLFTVKKLLEEADNVVVLGSSLVVNPLADLIKDYGKSTRVKRFNKMLFIINDSETPVDFYATKYEENLEIAMPEFTRIIK